MLGPAVGRPGWGGAWGQVWTGGSLSARVLVSGSEDGLIAVLDTSPGLGAQPRPCWCPQLGDKPVCKLQGSTKGDNVREQTVLFHKQHSTRKTNESKDCLLPPLPLSPADGDEGFKAALTIPSSKVQPLLN